MIAPIFIYKKGYEIRFENLDDALQIDNSLRKEGWTHTATINPAAYLSKIHSMCMADLSSGDTINDIITLLESE